jgi:hypothetical protein
MYVYNNSTALWYLVTATIEDETGLVTLTVDQTGVAENPGYIPTIGQPLCPIEYYFLVFNLDPVGFDGNKYMLLAMAQTRYAERYCNQSWLNAVVPEDLMYLSALMIRDQYDQVDNHKDSRLQSESVKNYSYTLAAGTPGRAQMGKWDEDLSMFRMLAFA